MASPQVCLPSSDPLSEDHLRLPPYFHISTKLITSPSQPRADLKGINHALTSVGFCAPSGTRGVPPSVQFRPRKTSALYFPPTPPAPYNEPGMKTGAAGGLGVWGRTLPWMCQRPQPPSSLTGRIKDSAGPPLPAPASRRLLTPHSSSIHQSLSSSLLRFSHKAVSFGGFPSGN